MVDVEHRALRALEQDVRAATCEGRAAPAVTSATSGLIRSPCAKQASSVRPEVDRRLAEAPLEQEVVVFEQLREPRLEMRGIRKFADAHRAARDLVLVGRADSAAGRADLAISARPFAGAVDHRVRGEHERAQRAHAEALEYRYAAPCQHVGLGQERLERHDDAIADETAHAIAQHARGDQRENGLDAVDDERVAGIVPALESRDRGDALGQQVDDLALSLIAPLGADDDDEAAHGGAQDADEPEQRDSGEHACGTGDAKRRIIHRADSPERAPDSAGTQERQDAFDHEQQAKRGRKVGPCDVHGMSQRPDCFRYLKNSPLGAMTRTSFGWPM